MKMNNGFFFKYLCIHLQFLLRNSLTKVSGKNSIRLGSMLLSMVSVFKKRNNEKIYDNIVCVYNCFGAILFSLYFYFNVNVWYNRINGI